MKINDKLNKGRNLQKNMGKKTGTDNGPDGCSKCSSGKSESETSRKEWDELFARRTAAFPPEPFLVDHFKLPKGARILDLACGDGRNALWLAKSGFRVTAVDFSAEGIKRLEDQWKNQQNSPVDSMDSTSRNNIGSIDTYIRDLRDTNALEGMGQFDSVIISHYVPPFSLFRKLVMLLKPGGIVFFVAFSPEMAEIRPDRIELILDINILKQNLGGLELEKTEHFKDQRGYFTGCILSKPEEQPLCYVSRHSAI